jgi:chlorobactene glucosyltransferase
MRRIFDPATLRLRVRPCSNVAWASREELVNAISIIVPARDEEQNLEPLLRSVSEQEGVREIIVVDDQSNDGTQRILKRLTGEIPALRAVRVDFLPQGWIGKNYALHIGAKVATGEWLLFTDADTRHQPGSLTAMLERAKEENADLLSLSPGQEVKTWWEKSVIPLVYVEAAKLYPYEEVSRPDSEEAAANGQYILIRREVYERTGGHEAIRSEVLEDVALARRVKACGGRLTFLLGRSWVRTRMYQSFWAMWEGWSKNLYLLYRKRLGQLLAAVASLWLLDLVPFFGLLFSSHLRTRQALEGWAAACVSVLAWRHSTYTQALAKAQFSRRVAVYRLPGVAIYSCLLLNSARKYLWSEKIQWKGRSYGVRS